MYFKKIRSSKLPYKKQGLICFTCLNYADQPKEVQEKILRLCHECGGDYWQELFDMMTTEKGVQKIAMDNYVAVPTLYRKRQKFYDKWFQLD